MLAAGEVDEAGVWLPEQVVSRERFFEALRLLGYAPTLEEPVLAASRRRHPLRSRVEIAPKRENST